MKINKKEVFEMKMLKVISRSVSFVVFLGFTLSVLGCIAAIPVAIKYYKSENQTVAKAEVAVPPEKVYATVVSIAEEKDVKVLKKEDEKFYIEVTDGKQTASVKVEKTDKGTTAITVTASVSSEETKEQKEEQRKELAHRIIGLICERLNAQCTVEKE